MLPGRFGDGVASIAVPLVILILAVETTAMVGCSSRDSSHYPPNRPVSSYSWHPSSERIEVASWYGAGFAGHSTSNGETFNPNALTAASTTLRLGSRVQVTNPDNGRSVVVRINDRGPFVRGRSLDLSRRAAQQIGLTGKGVGRVRVATAAAPSYGGAGSAPASVHHGAFIYASNTTRSTYVRRTAYLARNHRSRKTAMVSNPVGAWLIGAIRR